MAVNAGERLFFEKIAQEAQANPPKPLSCQTIAEFRVGAGIFAEYAGQPANVDYEDRLIPARDGHQIRARVFNHHLLGTTPVMIIYPGCGYILDLFDVNAVACSRIAEYSGIKIILIDFRLAPEYPLPQAIYDAYDATQYIAAHADKLKIDVNRIFIGGFSSGAHCAAVISHLARRDEQLNIYHQILLNGIYDLTQSRHEYDHYSDEDKLCTKDAAAFLLKHWGIGANNYTNPLFSPYYEQNVTNLPPTTLLVGEYDGLRNSSEAYFEKLKSGGNNVQKIVLPGQTHNTIIMREVFVDGEDPAHAIARVIRSSWNYPSC